MRSDVADSDRPGVLGTRRFGRLGAGGNGRLRRLDSARRGGLGRRTFGPGAGAAAAALAACQAGPYRIFAEGAHGRPVSARVAVGDRTGRRFLERPGFFRALAFGLAVGLAQNTKYNGWVALVVVALAALAGSCCRRRTAGARSLLRLFGWGFVAACVAGLTYLPWFAFVEWHGGYAALLRHHRGYVGNLHDWLPNWRQQLAQVAALSGGMAVGALAGRAPGWRRAIAVHGRRLLFLSTRWEGCIEDGMAARRRHGDVAGPRVVGRLGVGGMAAV